MLASWRGGARTKAIYVACVVDGRSVSNVARMGRRLWIFFLVESVFYFLTEFYLPFGRTFGTHLVGGWQYGLTHAFRGEFEAGDEAMGKRDVIRHAFVGGYPEQLDFSEPERRRWFRGYLEDLLTKDVKDVTEIRKIDVLKEVAVWLMAHSSQYFAVDDLCTRAGISKQTAENYMEALRALYVFDKVPAWSKSDYDRIGKRAKWIVADTGLMANIQKWKEDVVFEVSAQNGKLVESWVYHELAAQADVLGGYEISQYRDKDKREIDFLIENDDGALLGVEVKAGALVGEDDFKHMKWFAKNPAKTPFAGIVLYAGKGILPFGNGFHAVPMSCLA